MCCGYGVETATYLNRLKQAGVGDNEREGIVDMLARDPEAGTLIPGGGGPRKVRYAKEGGGKRGGYRLITYYAAIDIPVFIFDVYGKGQQANISKAGLNELSKKLASIAARYRAGSTAAAAMERKEKGTS